MCLITKQKDALIAEEDMTVYKVLYPELRNYAYDDVSFQYSFGELFKTEIKHSQGMWSMADEKVMKWIDELIPRFFNTNDVDDLAQHGFYAYGPGFHSYATLDRIDYCYRYFASGPIIVECKIPKGSEYYTDETGLLVSNQIIIVKEINKNNI